MSSSQHLPFAANTARTARVDLTVDSVCDHDPIDQVPSGIVDTDSKQLFRVGIDIDDVIAGGNSLASLGDHAGHHPPSPSTPVPPICLKEGHRDTVVCNVGEDRLADGSIAGASTIWFVFIKDFFLGTSITWFVGSYSFDFEFFVDDLQSTKLDTLLIASSSQISFVLSSNSFFFWSLTLGSITSLVSLWLPHSVFEFMLAMMLMMLFDM